MRLRDRQLLIDYMEDPKHDFSQARLARYAGVSRQFIHMLVTGEKKTCTPRTATLIEEAFGLRPRTLFDPKESSAAGPSVQSQATGRGKAA